MSAASKGRASEVDTLGTYRLCMKLIQEYSSGLTGDQLHVPINSPLSVQTPFLDKLVKAKVQELTDMLFAVRKIYTANYTNNFASGDTLKLMN